MPCQNEKMHLDRRVPIAFNGNPLFNPYDNGNQLFNPIGTGGVVVRTEDGSARIFAKITEFPVPEDCPWAAETMYVLLDVTIPSSIPAENLQNFLEKHMYFGSGILMNHPRHCRLVKHGDRIRFKGGSKGIKPIFDGKIGLNSLHVWIYYVGM